MTARSADSRSLPFLPSEQSRCSIAPLHSHRKRPDIVNNHLDPRVISRFRHFQFTLVGSDITVTSRTLYSSVNSPNTKIIYHILYHQSLTQGRLSDNLFITLKNNITHGYIISMITCRVTRRRKSRGNFELTFATVETTLSWYACLKKTRRREAAGWSGSGGRNSRKSEPGCFVYMTR